MAGRAILVAGERDVVERRRLRAEGRGRERRVALEAETIDAGADQPLVVGGAVRLVAGRAVAHDAVDVLEDEGSPLLGVTLHAGQLGDAGQPQGLLDRASVWFVAGGAFHPAPADSMGEGLVTERSHLRGVARGTELRGLLRQQVRSPRLRRVHGVAGEAVHGLRGSMNACLEGRVFLVARVTGDAEIRPFASMEGSDVRLVLAARFHVLDDRAVAGVAGRAVRARFAPGDTPDARVRIARERLGLIVAVGANRGVRFCGLGGRRLLSKSRAGGEPGEDEGADSAENPGFHRHRLPFLFVRRAGGRPRERPPLAVTPLPGVDLDDVLILAARGFAAAASRPPEEVVTVVRTMSALGDVAHALVAAAPPAAYVALLPF